MAEGRRAHTDADSQATALVSGLRTVSALNLVMYSSANTITLDDLPQLEALSRDDHSLHLP